jgi:ferric-dicitrate binding protein FerR (iron transport regulator)
MKKSLIIKYIKGDVTDQEEKEVLEWIDKSPDNERYFLSLNNLWIFQNISNEKAGKQELEEIQELTTKKRPLLISYRKWIPYAAAIVILISVGLNISLIKKDNSSKDIPIRLSELPSIYRHEIYTEKGVKAKIILPDSTSVWLNSDSKIVFPDRFESDIREIEFSGEAYFDVKKDSLRPLVIKTNKNFIVEVLGTSFNLKSYDNDNEARTTLYSGSLNVISQVKNIRTKETKEIVTTLKPLESCIIRSNQNPIHLKSENPKDQTAWKDGRILFESTPMSETIKMLERWHGVEFVVKDPSVYEFDITAKFKSESIVQIMELIKYCTLVDYSLDSNRVILFKRKL